MSQTKRIFEAVIDCIMDCDDDDLNYTEWVKRKEYENRYISSEEFDLMNEDELNKIYGERKEVVR